LPELVCLKALLDGDFTGVVGWLLLMATPPPTGPVFIVKLVGKASKSAAALLLLRVWQRRIWPLPELAAPTAAAAAAADSELSQCSGTALYAVAAVVSAFAAALSNCKMAVEFTTEKKIVGRCNTLCNTQAR
jgi:hypothetical protein